MADPILVKEARRRTGGHALTDITPQHLGVIAKAFPGEENYAKQRFAAKLAKENNMNVPTTRAMVGALQRVTTLAEMRQLAKGVDWKTVAPVHSPSRTRELAHLARQRSIETPLITLDVAELSRKLVLSELRASRLQLGAMVLQGSYTAPRTDERAVRYAEVDSTQDDRIRTLVVPVDMQESLKVFQRAHEAYHDRLLAELLHNPRL